MAVAQLGATGQQDLETAISAAVKRHHEEEIQLIKDNLTKTVRVSVSDVCWGSDAVPIGKERPVSTFYIYWYINDSSTLAVVPSFLRRLKSSLAEILR